ncbi:allatostatin-A receptor-like [Diadema antillarum]|uniref:allatostatin-A receptor-like n=1 Tax=Diadema antillarum TaxID=105358 RepID=UPI003A8B29CE
MSSLTFDNTSETDVPQDQTSSEVNLNDEAIAVTSDNGSTLSSLEFSSETAAAAAAAAAATYSWAWDTIVWSPWTVMELGCAILGMVGNGLVILVVFKRRNTNRSTDILIGALAWADFLTSFFIVPWPEASLVPNSLLGHVYCKFMYPSVLKWASISASIYTLVGISLDRYLAIVFPLKVTHIVTKGRLTVCIVTSWTVIMAVTLCECVFPARFDKSLQNCVYDYGSRAAQLSYGCFVFIYRLVFPTLTMFITQLLIASCLYRQSKRFNKVDSSRTTGSAAHLVARDRVIKMMLLVIIIYVICWGPNQLFFMGINLRIIPFTFFDTPLHRFLTLLAFMNSCANPLIYAARHPQFRDAVRELFVCGLPTNVPVFGDNEQSDESRLTDLSALT